MFYVTIMKNDDIDEITREEENQIWHVNQAAFQIKFNLANGFKKSAVIPVDDIANLLNKCEIDDAAIDICKTLRSLT